MMGIQLERNKYCLCNSGLPALVVTFSGPCEAVFKKCVCATIHFPLFSSDPQQISAFIP